MEHDRFIGKSYVKSRTWASVATVRPNVSATRTMKSVSEKMMEPQPITTRRNVPTNSATSMRHIALFSVISERPKMLPAPETGTLVRNFSFDEVGIDRRFLVTLAVIADPQRNIPRVYVLNDSSKHS
jgi:hypothetical protein